MSKAIFFGHHKCATKWMSSIMMDVRQLLGYKVDYFAGKPDQPNELPKINQAYEMLFCMNSRYRYLDLVKTPYKAVHLIRDPRDIVVSGYFSHKVSHEMFSSISELRQELQELSTKEGIQREFDFLKDEFNDMINWDYSNSNILEIKYEDVTNNFELLVEIFLFLGLLQKTPVSPLNKLFRVLNKLNNRGVYPFRHKVTISKNELKIISDKYAFEKMSGNRSKGTEDITSHYRKGVAGDWKNFFDEELKTEFKTRYGDLLVKLGYEKLNNW